MPRAKKSEKPAEKIQSVIERLEKARSSKVIVYTTSDKQPIEQFGTVIALDILPHFKKILESFGEGTKKITLAIHTNGGLIETPWPLVNLIREYCKQFEVIILEKALSAGTMVALGADRIVMFPYSHLSPIDPARNIIDGEKQKVERIEIEDIIGYIDFVKEKVGLSEQNALAECVKELTKETKPTLLGSINRTHALIRRLARLLFEIHTKKVPEKQIKEIVESLTQKLYSHGHMINRREAKEMIGFGDIIEYGNKVDKVICEELIHFCKNLMETEKTFDPAEKLAGEVEKNIDLVRACILSSENSFVFSSGYQLLGIPDQSGRKQFTLNNTKNEWKEYE